MHPVPATIDQRFYRWVQAGVQLYVSPHEVMQTICPDHDQGDSGQDKKKRQTAPPPPSTIVCVMQNEEQPKHRQRGDSQVTCVHPKNVDRRIWARIFND